MAEIVMESLEKFYATERAIHDVNLKIADGEFVAFVGPSGCGKSTLLRMIAGLEEISGGVLRIDGRVVNAMEPRARDVAMVFQDYALYPHMTVEANIGFGLKMRGVPAEEIAQRVHEVALTLQIEHLLKRKPGQLSGGQRQRVAMGRAVVRKPTVFLFDEPLSNLDAKLRVDMRTQIKRLHALLRTTTVYVTHDQIEAMTLADRIVILRDGEIEQHGEPIELYRAPRTRFVAEFIGSPQMNLLDATLVGEGADVAAEIGPCRLPIGPAAGLPIGERVWLGLRPEHLELDESAPLAAEVELIEATGSDKMVLCRLGSQELTARVPADRDIAVGERLAFTVERSRVHLFDTKTQTRLASPGSA